MLGSLSVGTDHLDLTALAHRGVQVVTTPGVNAVSVAEHALMMILALAKRMLPAHTAVATGRDRAGLVGVGLLRLLPSGAFVVNVARKEIFDVDVLRTVVAERRDLRFAVDDFGLAEDGTVAAVGDQGLWSPHIAGVTVEASAAMQDLVVRGVVQAVTSHRPS